MSRFDDLKRKKQFINKSIEYSEGIREEKAKRITLSMTKEYISLLDNMAKKERLSKSQIVRASLLGFSTLSKQEKENVYSKIFLK